MSGLGQSLPGRASSKSGHLTAQQYSNYENGYPLLRAIQQ